MLKKSPTSCSILALLLSTVLTPSDAFATSAELEKKPSPYVLVPYSFGPAQSTYITFKTKNIGFSISDNQFSLSNTIYHAFNPLGFEVINPEFLEQKIHALEKNNIHTSEKTNTGYIPGDKLELDELKSTKDALVSFQKNPQEYVPYIVGDYRRAGEDATFIVQPLSNFKYSNVNGAFLKDGTRLSPYSHTIRLCKKTKPVFRVLYSKDCISPMGIRFKDIIFEVGNPNFPTYGALYKIDDLNNLEYTRHWREFTQYTFDFVKYSTIEKLISGNGYFEKFQSPQYHYREDNPPLLRQETFDWSVEESKQSAIVIERYIKQRKENPQRLENRVMDKNTETAAIKAKALRKKYLTTSPPGQHRCVTTDYTKALALKPYDRLICPSLMDVHYVFQELEQAGYRVTSTVKDEMSAYPTLSWKGKLGLETRHRLYITVTKP